MNPKQEARSLAKDPLPEEDYDDPLHSVQFYDYQIAELKKRLLKMTEERLKILDHIIKKGITEERELTVMVGTRTSRVWDVKVLKETYPVEYELCLDVIKKKHLDQMDKAEEEITLGLADEIVGKTNMNKIVTYNTVTTSIEVITKEAAKLLEAKKKGAKK